MEGAGFRGKPALIDFLTLPNQGWMPSMGHLCAVGLYPGQADLVVPSGSKWMDFPAVLVISSIPETQGGQLCCF